MQGDAVMQGVRTTGDYQYWLGNNHVLDLKGNVSQSAGGAVSFQEHVVDYGPELDDWKEYATTFTGFKKLTISNNRVIRPQDEAECIGSFPVEYNGGGIYGQLAGNLEITGNTAVNISGNSAECGGNDTRRASPARGRRRGFVHPPPGLRPASRTHARARTENPCVTHTTAHIIQLTCKAKKGRMAYAFA